MRKFVGYQAHILFAAWLTSAVRPPRYRLELFRLYTKHPSVRCTHGQSAPLVRTTVVLPCIGEGAVKRPIAMHALPQSDPSGNVVRSVSFYSRFVVGQSHLCIRGVSILVPQHSLQPHELPCCNTYSSNVSFHFFFMV